MRVAGSFLTILLIVLLLGIGGFFIAREVILSWGVNSFKASLQKLALQSRNGSYATQCAADAAEGLPIETQAQLRFTSNTEYVLEVTCDTFSTNPILISKNVLPPFITKVPGGSGVIWGNGRSAIELQVFNTVVQEIAEVAKIDVSFLEKKRIIGVEDMAIVVFEPTEKLIGAGPVTSCEGYGFQCCKVETQVGVGERITGLTACSDTCYSSCSSRPLVLSFMSTPLFHPSTREVTISSGEMVDFSFVADAPDGTTVQATVDFGDGATPTVIDSDTGKLTHKYECAYPTCTYVARIKLLDNWRVASYDASINSITIVVAGK